jgi:hypothetical protein
MIPIDKHIPMPDVVRWTNSNKIYKRGRPVKYPFSMLKVGDSFFTPVKKVDLWRYQNVFGHRYTFRKVDGGIRIWRIK